jgi:hypothetical protein
MNDALAGHEFPARLRKIPAAASREFFRNSLLLRYHLQDTLAKEAKKAKISLFSPS